MAESETLFRLRPRPADRAVPIPDGLLAPIFAFSIFFPVLAAKAHNSLTPTIALLLAIWFNCWFIASAHTRRSWTPAFVFGAYACLIIVWARLLNRTAGPLYSVTFERLLLLMPLAVAVGWMLVRTRHVVLYLSWLIVAAVLSVPLAVVEFFGNVTLLRADHAFYVRNGQTRAVVGADHPLVLGALLVAMMPFVVYLLRTQRVRYLLLVALYLGVWMTGSNGPEVVGGVVFVTCMFPLVARLLLTYRAVPLTILTGLGVFVVVGGLFFWSNQLQNSTTTQASDAYRGALYNLMPHLLSSHPFGFGFYGLPPSSYLFYATYSPIDVSHSIDSELVYSVTQFGWLAVVVFVAIAVLGALAAVRHQAFGLSCLSITVVGLFLALHSWTSLGEFWAITMGFAAAVVAPGGDVFGWTGMSRRLPLRQRGDDVMTTADIAIGPVRA